MSRTAGGRVVVELARDADEPGIRALLRALPMAGAIRLTLEREPESRVAAAAEGLRHHTVVARDPSGRIVGAGTRSVIPVWLDGAPALLGYLGQLRLAPDIRGRRHLLAAGFAALAATRQPDELPFDVTSVVADNAPALRLLGADVRGLPAYRPLSDFVTLVLRPRRRAARKRWRAAFSPRATELAGEGGDGLSVAPATDTTLDEAAACLERNRSRLALGARVDAAALRSSVRCPDLEPSDVLLARRGDRTVGCLALWDQRRFKQTVVHGYATALALARPLLAAVAPLVGAPRLPAPGATLGLASVFAFAVDGDDPAVFDALLAAARDQAARRGLDGVLVGLPAKHPRLGTPGRAGRALTGARRYASRLFAVATDPVVATAAAVRIGAGGVQLEVAWL